MTAPTRQLLEWIQEERRSYRETIEAWHSHCPRLTVWEDAIHEGLVAVKGGAVVLTERGRAQLADGPGASIRARDCSALRDRQPLVRARHRQPGLRAAADRHHLMPECDDAEPVPWRRQVG